jgi:hypothetical protein
LEKVTDDMRTALGPLADASTLLLGYAQIVSSLLVTLPRVEWPEPFASIARLLGVFPPSNLNPSPDPNPDPGPNPNLNPT